MNHAEQVKASVEALIAAPMGLLCLALRDVHRTIDAMQSALDDAVAKLAARDAEAERLSKDAMQKAWYAIGADLAGLKWSDFIAAIDAALSEEVKGGE